MLLVFLFIKMLGISCAGAMPLELKPKAGLTVEIYVNIPVNGKPRRFALDTGSESTIIALDADSAMLKTLGQSKLFGASGNSQHCDKVEVERFEVDNLTKSKFALERCASPYSLLGMDVFAGAKVALRFSTAELLYIDRLPSGLPVQTMVQSDRKQILLPLTVAGLETIALFDTGWAITAIDVHLIEVHPELFEPVPTTRRGVDITGRQVVLRFFKVKQLMVGKLDLRDQLVEAHEFPDDPNATANGVVHAILGANTIQQADWYFDLDSNRWAVRF